MLWDTQKNQSALWWPQQEHTGRQVSHQGWWEWCDPKGAKSTGGAVKARSAQDTNPKAREGSRSCSPCSSFHTSREKLLCHLSPKDPAPTPWPRSPRLLSRSAPRSFANVGAHRETLPFCTLLLR